MSESVGTGVRGWLRADPRRFDVVVAVVTVSIGGFLVVANPEGTDSGWPEVAAGIGAFVMLVLRRWHPRLLLLVALAWTATHVGLLERPTPTIFAVLVLLATACVRLERWPAIALGGSIAGSLYVMGLLSNDAELGDARAVIGIAWTAGAIGIADAVRSWRRYRESAEAQVRSAVLAAEAQTRQEVSEERLTIARELHDLLAHNLSVMNVQTGAALHLLRSDPDQAEESLTAARDAGRSVLDELRELLSVLRHGDGDEAPISSLPSIDELPRLVETMRSTGLDVEWSQTGAPRSLAPAVALAGYRIVQEALTNAAKHGDGRVRLGTAWQPDGVRITVSNPVAVTDGEVDERGSGHGLVGMRERAAVNGGRLSAGIDGEMFRVDAWLPATPVAEPA